MIQQQFIEKVIRVVENNPSVLGLAAGGSWITGEIDEFSDLDLIFVTSEKVSGSREEMLRYAGSFGALISAFTGEHVGESRLLICLFGPPLLHVDIKFLAADELYERVENPAVLWEREHSLSDIIASTKPEWPGMDFQWIEDRFWTWIHYAVLKLGRGENFEALDFLSFLRVNVTAPLLQLKNGMLPRGLRKVEFSFPASDIDKLAATVPAYTTGDIFVALENTVSLYRDLRDRLFPESVRINREAERIVTDYFHEIKKRKLLQPRQQD